MKRVFEFFKQAGTGSPATLDGDQPASEVIRF